MADASRFPEGLLLTGTDVTVPAPVGTIKQNAAGQLVRSTSAAAAAYSTLNGLLPSSVTADPGTGAAIPVTQSTHVSITTVGAETNTLAIPTFIGQVLTMEMAVDGGDRVVTVASAINLAGNTIITFNTVLDNIMLIAMEVAGTLAWRVVFNDGTTLS